MQTMKCLWINCPLMALKLLNLCYPMFLYGICAIPSSNVGFLSFSYHANSHQLRFTTHFYLTFSYWVSVNVIFETFTATFLVQCDVFAVTESKIHVIMDHMKCFMLVCKGLILAENLLANVWQNTWLRKESQNHRGWKRPQSISQCPAIQDTISVSVVTWSL